MLISENKRLNKLSGKTWLKYSFSIWRDIRKSNEEAKLKHPAMFPVALTSQLIEIFTKEGEIVFDPLMGCGSAVISAFLKKRKGYGIELSPEFYRTARMRINEARQFDDNYIEPEIYNDDARNLLKYFDKNSVTLCITSPPYWDVLNRKRTADFKDKRNYSDSKFDIGNIKYYEDFLCKLKRIFEKVYEVLKPGGYCVIIVMDIRKKNIFYPLHSDLANKLGNIGYKFEDIIIWDRQHEYNNMRPLGYPYKFRVNKVHEYILIFSKA